MDIQPLFGDFTLARFIGEHLHRLPFALHGTAEFLTKLANWEVVERIILEENADLLLVREGDSRSLPDGWQPHDLQRAIHDGWTIRLRNVQNKCQSIRGLAATFEKTFRGPVDVHIYVTPPGKRGLSWHYDAEDVFIIQASGEKEYLLRKNTVNPWPLAETMPQDLRYERELMPLSRVLLGPGDLLYIPCGYWHRTESPSTGRDAATSLAIGVMSRTAIDLMTPIRAKFAHSLAWRQRLPVGTETDLRERTRTMLAQVANDTVRLLRSEEFLEETLQVITGGDTGHGLT
jgi:ribosomal protein L16 Arg81 hydroxylase